MEGSCLEGKSRFEIKRFEESDFDMWTERMKGILFLKEREEALAQIKLEGMRDAAWSNLNKKAIIYIKIAVYDESFAGFEGACHCLWSVGKTESCLQKLYSYEGSLSICSLMSLKV
ncbi:hypothetical protein KP509_19G000400 [Ceratopteris richardii]|uniref:Uncharacterized protein n=1 Tax=Ceratopteris richardii TaxID=49495 RepID=A0A8T2SJ76_CERRI|nr:hypothetical protein KP509_19G000400 [Ceratopteris richardii]